MEKKDWEKRLLEASFIYTGRDVGVIETITFDYDKLKNFISQELDRAREEGFIKGVKECTEKLSKLSNK